MYYTMYVLWGLLLPIAWYVGRSVTLVSPTKTAEPIEMPLGLWARMGPRNHVLDWGPGLPWEGPGVILREEGAARYKV